MEKIKVPYVLDIEKLVDCSEKIIPVISALPYLIKFNKLEATAHALYDAERQLTVGISDSCSFCDNRDGMGRRDD